MIKQITCYGDSGVVCDFGDEVKKEINLVRSNDTLIPASFVSQVAVKKSDSNTRS